MSALSPPNFYFCIFRKLKDKQKKQKFGSCIIRNDSVLFTRYVSYTEDVAINTKETMRYIIIVLFLTLISCKNEAKSEIKSEPKTELETENGTYKSVSEMWNNFTKSNPEFKNEEIPQSDFFHNNKEDANRLAELTVNGKKKASSGLYSLYKQYNVDLPKVGNKQIITDFDGKAKAIILTKSVDTIPFNEISKIMLNWIWELILNH